MQGMRVRRVLDECRWDTFPLRRCFVLTLAASVVLLTGCDKIKEMLAMRAKAKTAEVDEETAFVTYRELLMGKGTNEVMEAFGKPQSIFETDKRTTWAFHRWRVVFNGKMEVVNMERDVASHYGGTSGPIPGADRLAALGGPDSASRLLTPPPEPEPETQAPPTPNIIRVSDDGAEVDLNTLIPAGKVAIVDFYADWCGPCRAIAPHLQQLARSNPDLVLIKIDIVRWGTPVARQYNIESVPNIRVFNRYGQQVGSPTHDLGQVQAYLKQAAL